MNYPTHEEIRIAHDAINADGPAAETTIRLHALVLHDPVLRAILNRMTQAAEWSSGRPMQSAILAAIVTGLNYGLRMAAGREKAGGAS